MRFVLLLCVASPGLAAPTITPAWVPVAGQQRAVLTVDRAGRYAIEVGSKHRTNPILQDRMKGLGLKADRTQFNRLDVFLDAGEYRLVTRGAKDADGLTRLKVTAFADRSRADERLPERSLASSALGDLEARGWWIDVSERRTVAVEAIGRALGTVRLWRDGQWLDATPPRCKTRSPIKGRAQRHCTLTAPLEPGLYRVVAYGMPPLAWTDDDAPDRDALHVRWGQPVLAAAGARHHVISPFGEDRLQVPAGLQVVEWSVPEAVDTAVSVADLHASRPFAPARQVARLTPKSRRPVARSSRAFAAAIIIVSGVPGQTGVLRWLRPTSQRFNLSEAGRWFVRVVSTATPDTLPVTAITTRRVGDRDVEGPSATLRLDGTRYGRFNLQGTSELFVRVDRRATWTFTLGGGRLRVEPWWTRPPPIPGGYHPPAFMPEAQAQLDPGLYRVTMTPDQAGMVELNITANGADAPRPLVAEIAQWPAFEVASTEAWSVHLATVSGVDAGVLATKLPAPLADGLPLRLAPNAPTLVPVMLTDGVIRARSTDGAPLPVSLDGVRWAESVEAEAGLGTVAVQNRGDSIVEAEVRVEPAAAAGAKLPRLTDAQRARLPDFPTLHAREDRRVDLAKDAASTWLVDVRKPGLYALESTGLLATEGTLRTRTRTQLAKNHGGGSGRNFALARYLRAGSYQLTVRPRGESAGAAGLRLRTAPLIAGGPLVFDRPGRIQLRPNEAAVYTFTLAKRHAVRIESKGRRTIFKCRVEDADGWPIMVAERCSRRLTLDAGAWRVVLLPERIETVRRTLITSAEPAPALAGAGPHPIPFDRSVEHVWSEPEDPARPPHVYTFDLPADAAVELSASDTIVADLLGPDGARVARVAPGRSWTGELIRGPHRVEVRAAHRDNGVEYRLTLRPTPLLPGMIREVQARPWAMPSTTDRRAPLPTAQQVPFAVGVDGLYTLSTRGDLDVRLAVFGPDGAVLGANDDRPDDWDAQLTLPLSAGAYTAGLATADGAGWTELGLRHELPADHAPIAVGGAVEVVPTLGGVRLPIAGDTPILRAGVVATETVGLALEAQTPSGWRVMTEARGRSPTIAARPAPGGRLRLRLWTLDGFGRPATLTVQGLKAKPLSAKRWSAGRRGQQHESWRIAGGAGLFGDLRVPKGSLLCPAVGVGCAPLDGPTVALGLDAVWIAAPGRFSGRRLRLDGPLIAPLGRTPTVVDLPAGTAPVWVSARAPSGAPFADLGGLSAVGVGASLAVNSSGEARSVSLRSVDGAPVQARLRMGRLKRRAPIALDDEPSSGDLAPGESITVGAAAGIRAVLGRGAAILADDVLLWADAEHRVFEVPGTTFTVLNPSESPAPFELTAIVPARLTVGGDAPLVHRPTETATLPVRVPAGDGRLRLVGAEGTLHRVDGVRSSADGSPIGPGGWLLLEQRRSPILAWQANPGRSSPWAPAESTRVVEGPGVVPLGGQAIALELRLAANRMAQISGPRGLALVADSGAVSLDGRLDLWLPDGRAKVTVRRLDDRPLSGSLRVSSTQAVTVGEGVGPPTLLSPGATRVFEFTTHRTAKVGIGVRAEADRVQLRLLDAEGRERSGGGALMPELEPGTWLLAMHLPEDAAPVLARPVLVGIEERGDGPPSAVVQKYLPARGADR